jgi:hypothetical protein
VKYVIRYEVFSSINYEEFSIIHTCTLIQIFVYVSSGRKVQLQGLRPQVYLAVGQPPEVPGEWRWAEKVLPAPGLSPASRLGSRIF